ncbi:MAG: T9SS type A sorting domain-containing protein [Saprospiraceae bacterium]|nr:T9SS type A sorting domain-containing protein [Saprospiraceae bacterium]
MDKWWYFPEEIASATEELISHGKLTIYPIPGHDVINVILPDDAFLPVRYRITDMQGHTHESGVQNQRDIKLDAGFLPSGIYHVVIMDKSGRRWTGKWVKD